MVGGGTGPLRRMPSSRRLVPRAGRSRVRRVRALDRAGPGGVAVERHRAGPVTTIHRNAPSRSSGPGLPVSGPSGNWSAIPLVSAYPYPLKRAAGSTAADRAWQVSAYQARYEKSNSRVRPPQPRGCHCYGNVTERVSRPRPGPSGLRGPGQGPDVACPPWPGLRERGGPGLGSRCHSRCYLEHQPRQAQHSGAGPPDGPASRGRETERKHDVRQMLVRCPRRNSWETWPKPAHGKYEAF